MGKTISHSVGGATVGKTEVLKLVRLSLTEEATSK